MLRRGEAVYRWVAPAALGLSLLAVGQGALANPAIYGQLLPGTLTGNVNAYLVKKGDTITAIATRFAVHPVRITKPNAEALKGGLVYNKTLLIDQRRITPRFASSTSGIVLNIPEAQVYLVEAGKLVVEYPVAVSTTESRAPLGRSRVVNKTQHPTWYVPASIQTEMAEAGREVKTQVPPGPENPLGTRWIGWADGSYGFHGTIVPSSIKRYASHGCVRFLRPHIEDLYDRVKVGTPVNSLYQPVLLAADAKAIWLSVYPDLYKLNYDFRGAVKQAAKQAGVLNRLDWPAVEKAIKAADGIVMDVALPLKAAPTPRPKPSPTPTPVSSPTPEATAAPSAVPDATPSPEPEASLEP